MAAAAQCGGQVEGGLTDGESGVAPGGDGWVAPGGGGWVAPGGGGWVVPGGGCVVPGGGCVVPGGGWVVPGGGGWVVPGGGGCVVPGGGWVVPGGGGCVVPGGGWVDPGGGGSVFVAGSVDPGAVLAGGTAAGAVDDGDGRGEPAGLTGVTGPGSARAVPAGAGVSPVPAAWDWPAVPCTGACAGVVAGGSGGTTRSGRPGPRGSPPVAGAVVTAAPGRICTVPKGAVCRIHSSDSATPVVATATAAIGASSHGDSSHPNRSRRDRMARGRPRRGGADVVMNQSPNASDWSAGRHPGSGGVTGAAGGSRTGRRRGDSWCDRRAGR